MQFGRHAAGVADHAQRAEFVDRVREGKQGASLVERDAPALSGNHAGEIVYRASRLDQLVELGRLQHAGHGVRE